MTEEEATRGIYFDFEGFRNGTPSMVGTLIGDTYTPTFLHPSFEAAAAHVGAPLVTLEDYAATLARKAQREDRRLFAYSIHEAEVLAKEVPHYAPALGPRFTNAHTLVRKWSNRIGRPLPRGDRSLKTYYALFFEPYPDLLADLSVPRTLARIASAGRRHVSWAATPPAVQALLDDLLAYNRLDCTATRALVLRTTR